jgi:hypothetical protein
LCEFIYIVDNANFAMSSLVEGFPNEIPFCSQENPEVLEYAARDFALSLAITYIAALLIEHAVM